MKIHCKLLTFMSLLVVCSCSDDEFIDLKPSNPSSFDIDIDDDGEPDYIMEYSHALVFAQNYDEQIIGRFNPYGAHEVLHKKNVQSLFLRNLVEIKETVSEPLFWNNTGFTEDVISISKTFSKGWSKEWDIHSDTEHDTYFLGLKLINDNSVQLGWVEFQISIKNGELTIVDKGVL